ncbi:hypothetical protein ANCCAN_13440, partial [Ancylostoma caninum]
LQKNIEAGIGKRSSSKPVLSLVAAYAYPNASVVTMEADGWFGEEVYCRYFDENRIEIDSPVKSVVYPEFVVYCCSNPLARFMSITEAVEESVMQVVPLLNRTVDDPKYSLSLCLSPLYGNESKWILLAELIEHYKLQGVMHFYVYIKDIDDYSRKLIDDYIETGEVETIFFSDKQHRMGKDWQLAGVKDCLHRSRYHSRYSIFADLDERIMTTTNNISLAEYVFILNLRQVCCGYTASGSILLSIRNVCETKNSFQVLDMWVHRAMAYFPGYGHCKASANEAILMHYRFSNDEWQYDVPQRLLNYGTFETWHYPEHLMRRLYLNIKERLDRVYGNSEHKLLV